MAEANVAAAPRRPSIIAPFLFALPVFALLVGLGVWQLERLEWKNRLVARIDARIHAPPVPLPPASEWPALAASDYEYTHVAVTGYYDVSTSTAIYRGSGHVGDGPAQPGYWVMETFRVTGGGTLFVNRGFVPLEFRDDPRRIRRLNTGEITITGLLRGPETRNLFTPPDNPDKGEWYTRDPFALAKAMNIADAAPFSLDEDPHPPAAAGMPAGGATVLDIPNNHLSYAFTWFGLAATLVAMLGLFTWRRARER
jgi:surfeit locus 1 family protein